MSNLLQVSEMEPLQTLTYNSVNGVFKINTYYQGTNEIPFQVFIDDQMIYESWVRPGIYTNIDDTQVLCDIIGFVSAAMEGDIEPKCETQYSEIDFLSLLVDDFETGLSAEIESYITTH